MSGLFPLLDDLTVTAAICDDLALSDHLLDTFEFADDWLGRVLGALNGSVSAPVWPD